MPPIVTIVSRMTSRRSREGRRRVFETLWPGTRSPSRRNQHATCNLAGGEIMTKGNQAGGKESLFLDDLYVGQRFTSGRHPIDEEQIRAFAQQFDPQPFH